MAKYIKYDDAINGFLQMLKQPGDIYHTDITTMLQSIPPADVRPVRRGRWVKATGSYFTPGGDPVWQCSECGKGRHVYGIEHGSYGADVSDGQWLACPNCMAIMEGESDG